VLIGSAFLLGGGLGLAFGNATIGFVVSSALCLAYIAVGRRFVRDRMRRPSIPPTPTRCSARRRGDAAHRPARAGAGAGHDEVLARGGRPEAVGALEPGTRVTVSGINGVTLL